MPDYKKNKGPGYRELQKQLNDALKAGQFSRVYLLYGSQSYLRNQNRDRIKESVLNGAGESGSSMGGAADSMNVTVYEGKDFTIRSVMETADTLPFFKERRVLLFENTGLFKDKNRSSDSEELAEYIKDAPDTSCFVFSEEQVDRTRKLYKAITSAKVGATVLNVDDIDPQDIKIWANGLFRKEGKNIEGSALALFLDYAGTDMLHILKEKEKLVSYVGDRSDIKAEDIREIMTPVVKDRIFEMIGAIALKDTRKAMGIYMDLKRGFTPPQVILSLMSSQYLKMMQVRDLMDRGVGVEEAAKEIGLNPYILRKNYLPACANYKSAEEIAEDYARCVRANLDYKSGKIKDELAVEILIAGR